MRVALFFDGKNHMKDLRRTAPDRWIDHGALAHWVVQHVGGTRFVGAWYYTGVPSAHEPRQEDGPDRHALTDLLEELEKKPGFFVRRFNRRATARECPHCHTSIGYTEEKMVDTSLVVDLVLMATRDAFDAAVVFSGDLDVAPALAAARALGKSVWIATFGDVGLSRSLVREAWSHIDLAHHLEAFAHPPLDLGTPAPSAPRVNGVAREPAASGPSSAPVVLPPAAPTGPIDPEETDREMLRELARAQVHFEVGGGFVGAHYFLHRWKGHAIPDSPEARRVALQRLILQGRAETYTVDGKTAVRVASAGPDDETDTISTGEEDDATVEMRLSETLVRRLRARLDDV